MKKVAIILMINIYALSTFGFCLKEFYCCGKLEKVSVSLTDIAKDKCAKSGSEDNCCKTKFQFYKIKDWHFSNDLSNNSVNHSISLTHFVNSFQIFPPSFQKVKVINSPHSPPLYNGVPDYISNCLFRI